TTPRISETTTPETQPAQRPPAAQEPAGAAEIQDSIEKAASANFLNFTPPVGPLNTSDTGPAGLKQIETAPAGTQGLNTELGDSNQSVAARYGVTMDEMGTAGLEDPWNRCLDLITRIRDMINSLPPDLQARAKSDFQALLQSLYPMIDAANPAAPDWQINDINNSLQSASQSATGDTYYYLDQPQVPNLGLGGGNPAPDPNVPPDALRLLREFFEQIQSMSNSQP